MMTTYFLSASLFAMTFYFLVSSEKAFPSDTPSWCKWCEESFHKTIQHADDMWEEERKYYLRNFKGKPKEEREFEHNYLVPQLSCELDSRDGFGDGPKWICGLNLLKSPCTVHSYGSAGSFNFEATVRNSKGGGPLCDLHIFDPTPGMEKYVAVAKDTYNATFHLYGIGAENMNIPLKGRKVPVKSFATIRKEHGGLKKIDILKMDVEGSEYVSLRPIFHMMRTRLVTVSILLVEVHFTKARNEDVFEIFEEAKNAGMYLYHEEMNGWGCGGVRCGEFGLAHRDWLEKVYYNTHCPFCVHPSDP